MRDQITQRDNGLASDPVRWQRDITMHKDITTEIKWIGIYIAEFTDNATVIGLYMVNCRRKCRKKDDSIVYLPLQKLLKYQQHDYPQFTFFSFFTCDTWVSWDTEVLLKKKKNVNDPSPISIEK